MLALWDRRSAMGHRGWTKAMGWVVRSVGGLIGSGKRSRPILKRGLGDTELEGDVVFSRSRRVPGRG